MDLDTLNASRRRMRWRGKARMAQVIARPGWAMIRVTLAAETRAARAAAMKLESGC